MLETFLTVEQIQEFLHPKGSGEIESAIRQGTLSPGTEVNGKPGFLLGDLIAWRLAQVMVGLGVEPKKARIYAETVLNPRAAGSAGNLLDWSKPPNQELYCLLEDNELARIYVRDKENRTEADIGAVKPVLLPTTRCEINVSRVIRPVLYWAKQSVQP